MGCEVMSYDRALEIVEKNTKYARLSEKRKAAIAVAIAKGKTER